jgi:hypothetical protein
MRRFVVLLPNQSGSPTTRKPLAAWYALPIVITTLASLYAGLMIVVASPLANSAPTQALANSEWDATSLKMDR